MSKLDYNAATTLGSADPLCRGVAFPAAPVLETFSSSLILKKKQKNRRAHCHDGQSDPSLAPWKSQRQADSTSPLAVNRISA